MNRKSGPKDWSPKTLSINDPRVNDLYKRIKVAAEKADSAFWAEIAKAFPEVKSGDVSASALFRWDNASQLAILEWLSSNYPNEFLLQPILDREYRMREGL